MFVSRPRRARRRSVRAPCARSKRLSGQRERWRRGHQLLQSLPYASVARRCACCSRSSGAVVSCRSAQTTTNARAVEDFEQAVRTSDVVALATHSREAVIAPEWGRARHACDIRRLQAASRRAAARFSGAQLARVETRLAFEPTPVGCAELAGLDGAAATELGEIELGTRPGRREREEITVYKAMGRVIEDIVAADLVYHRAREQAVGRAVVL